MKRRHFIRKSAIAGAAAGTFLSMGPLYGKARAFYNGPLEQYDMAAVLGGEPDEMFDRGIEALGGMSKFVKKGQTVVVKPNIGWDKSPEMAANTNPALVKRIIEHCYSAGAEKVYVFDHTCDEWELCYKNSAIEKAVKEAKGTIVPGNSEKYYKDVKVPKGKVLKETKVHELLLETDVFINVPVLKSHGSTKLTIAMKNLMGNVWDRRWWHKNQLNQSIADFTTWRKPDLNVVDAYRVMMANGPKGVSVDDVRVMKSLLISEDIVAVDTAAAKLFGLDPQEVKYIPIAAEMGLGEMDLDKLNIKRIKLS